MAEGIFLSGYKQRQSSKNKKNHRSRGGFFSNTSHTYEATDVALSGASSARVRDTVRGT